MIHRYKFRLLFLLFVIYILSFVDRQIVAVLASQIRLDLGLSNLQIGLLYGTAFSFIYALAGIPMGRIADQWSRKGMIAIGLFIWSLVTVLSGFAGSFTFLVICRMLLGLSQAMLSPAAYALLAESFSPDKRARVFSVYASGIFIGVGLSFLVGGSVSVLYDWRISMMTVGMPGLILAPFVWFLIRDVRKSEDTKKHPAVRETIGQLSYMLKKRTVLLHLTGFSALACTGYTILAFFSTVMTDLFQRPDLVPHFGWFLFGVGGMVILSGTVADKLAKKDHARRFWMGIFAALGGIPFYIAGLYSDDGFSALIFMGLGVLISSSYNGVAAALIQYFVKPTMRSLAGGLYLFVISVAGFGLGPPVTGWLMDNYFSGIYAISNSLITVIIVCGLIATISFTAAMQFYDEDAVQEIRKRR
ncbi:MAG TPA: MFS transporter [Balneolaceae bacterium]|nr:MFS transporter [Balneolaceae bacterium]